jgi:hypothetical protein
METRIRRFRSPERKTGGFGLQSPRSGSPETHVPAEIVSWSVTKWGLCIVGYRPGREKWTTKARPAEISVAKSGTVGCPTRGGRDLDSRFLDYWSTVAQRDSLLQKSLFIVTSPFSKRCKSRRIRAGSVPKMVEFAPNVRCSTIQCGAPQFRDRGQGRRQEEPLIDANPH